MLIPIRLLLTTFVLSGLTTSWLRTLADDRPNIIVLLCDDLGYGDLGCYGHPHIQTPNLDKLAQGGIRFTSFYSAAPVCSPSRVGLLTGRSPNRAGVYDWIPEANHGVGGRPMVHMRRQEPTVAKTLKQAGYQTAMAGKWHCNSHFNRRVQPQPDDAGFDHWLATQNNASPSHENPTNFIRNGVSVGKVDRFSCQFVVDEGLDWIDTLASERPFFLYLPFHEPHEPVASPQRLVDLYRHVAESDDQAHYFANVTNIDIAVGRLINGLEQRDIRDDTLVIFTSDNGPETLNRYKTANRSHGSPGVLRGMKLHTTEAGFRVAGIVNWPGRVSPGQTVATPVSSLDFYPTFAELANTKLPGNLTFDGTNLASAVDDHGIWTGDLPRDKPLIWVYYNAINEARAAMRRGKWKIIARLEGGRLKRSQNLTTKNADDYLQARLSDFEIYDLESDLSERHNLADEPGSPAQELIEVMQNAYEDLVEGSHVWESD